MANPTSRRADAGQDGRRPLAILTGPLGQGGSGKTIVQQTADLLALGYAVDLLTLGPDGPLGAAIPAGVRRVRLPSLHPLWGTWPLFGYLRRARPWAVLVHRLRLLRPLQQAHRLAGVPCRIAAVVHNHLGAQLEEGAGDRGRRGRSFERLRRCDALIAVSEETARDAAERLGLPLAAVRIAYPPVDTEALRVLASAEGGVARPARYLIGVGRLEAEKDFATLLRAFALVARQQAEVDLVILGEGRERPLLEGLAAELAVTGRVRLPGFLLNPYPWIAGARLLALSSRWEGFGIVLAEALALGVPVVATDCPGGPREILANGRFGTLVAPGDVQALAAAILATLAEPPDPARLRQGAERFAPATGLRAYLDALGLTGPEELA